ncbi:MAG TPA: endonuclease domain-containing protein [bacterium]|nr:endonuclease domain-containing protein [bacterium]
MEFALKNSMTKLQGKKAFRPLRQKLRQKLRQWMTSAEQILWRRLKAKRFFNLKFRRQHGIGPYIVDFYCAEKNLVVEIDGDVHAKPDKVKNDQEREAYLRKLNVKICRYCNFDVLKNLEGVLLDLAIQAGALPPPALQRRG